MKKLFINPIFQYFHFPYPIKKALFYAVLTMITANVKHNKLLQIDVFLDSSDLLLILVLCLFKVFGVELFCEIFTGRDARRADGHVLTASVPEC